MATSPFLDLAQMDPRQYQLHQLVFRITKIEFVGVILELREV